MGSPISVLIVEDSEDDALLLVRELRRGGFDPTYERVETAAAMQATLKKRHWDVVISDYIMPQFSGMAALGILKESGLDVPFIVVSGRVGEDAGTDILKAGARDYLTKGNLARLNPVIERELRHASGHVVPQPAHPLDRAPRPSNATANARDLARLKGVRPEILIVAFGVIVIVLVWYSFSLASNTLADHARLDNLNENLQLNTSLAYARFQQFIKGDSSVDLQREVYARIDGAVTLCRTGALGETTGASTSVPTGAGVADYHFDQQLCQRLQAWRDLTDARRKDKQSGSPDSHDAAWDETFNDIVQLAHRDSDQIDKKFEQEVSNLTQVNSAVLLLLVMLFTIFPLIVFRSRRSIEAKNAQLQLNAAELEQEIGERKRAEQAVQHAHVKLTGWVNTLEEQTHQITLLNEMTDLFQSCSTPDEAYTVITRFARQLFPMDSGALYLTAPSRNMVETVAEWGKQSTGIRERVFAPDECWALRRGRPHWVENSSLGLVCKHLGHPPPASYVCVPILAQGEALGVLYLESGARAPGAMDDSAEGVNESRKRLIVSVAEHIGLALSNLRLRETLRRQSIRDPLTGLFNRRYLEETLERELHRAARSSASVGVIMLDLDHFKHFNDTFGHSAGDVLLRELGNFLQTHIRGADIACRYGGEEFTLILPDTSLDVLCERAEQLRREVKHLNVQYQHQSLGAVSLSLGVAVFPEHGASAATVLAAADAALYRAKTDGRDRMVVAEPTELIPRPL